MNLPAALLDSLLDVPGFNEEAFKAVHQTGTQITSIRFNPAKVLKDQQPVFGAELERVPWCSTGFYQPQRPSFTLDPLFHAGAYYVQEASSMFLEQVLRQTVDLSQPLTVLDLCAAPGGKSTLIQSLVSKESLLVSNEVIKTRVNILAENITKWGAANVIVTNNDPKDLDRLPAFFDVMVVDAPCSGSGLFRKDPAAIEEWSVQNVTLCAQRQQRILADAIPALKEEGILIYSTCSYSEAEDEAIADWLLDEFRFESLPLNIDLYPGIVETISEKNRAYGYRFYPDKIKGEGFFIAAFKRSVTGEKEPGHRDQRSKEKKKKMGLTATELEVVNKFITGTGELFFIKQHEDTIALPASLEAAFTRIRSALYIKKAGVNLGTVIRNELIPSHELATSTILDPALPRIEVDKETALQYLRREEIKLDAGIKGWALLSYQELPLGWVKIMQNRINNYYPKEWRILNK